MKKILDILPDGFRRRSCGVVATLLARAVLDFAGLALLLPLLALLLDPEAFTGDGCLAAAYRSSGIASTRLFAGMVCGGVVLFTLLKGAAAFHLARIENRCLLDLYRALSRRIFIACHDRGMAFVDASDSATLVRNVNAVTRSFTTGVLRPAAVIVAETALLGVTAAVLFPYAPQAVLLALAVFLPVGWGYIRCFRRRCARYGTAENRALREKARIVGETFRGYADIELNGAFPEMLRAFDRSLDEAIRARAREADLNRLPPLVVETALAVGLALLAVGSFGKEGSALWFGVSAVAALRLMPAVRAILNGWVSIRYNRYTLDILRQALTAETEAKTEENPAIASGTTTPEESGPLPFERTIEVRQLAFRYPGCSREVLHGVDFTFRKGDRIGIRGASGVGKTTLLHLLAGLYEPTLGEIRIDGVPLTAANRRAWQQRIGYVSQRAFLRNASLAENIAPEVPPHDIDRKRVLEVIRTARLEAFAATLPRGIDTPVGECGARISGGQRQRIAIARALYRNADVLLFDEATSSLDPRTEAELLRSLEELAARNPRMTLFVIAHNGHSLAGCQRIIELEN